MRLFKLVHWCWVGWVERTALAPLDRSDGFVSRRDFSLRSRDDSSTFGCAERGWLDVTAAGLSPELPALEQAKYLRRRKQFSRARALALDLHDSGEPPVKAGAALELGRLHFELSFYREALDWARHAIQLAGANGGGSLDRAWAEAFAWWAGTGVGVVVLPPADPLPEEQCRWLLRMNPTVDANDLAAPDDDESAELVVAGLRQHRTYHEQRGADRRLRDRSAAYLDWSLARTGVDENGASALADHYDEILAAETSLSLHIYYAVRLSLVLGDLDRTEGLVDRLLEQPGVDRSVHLLMAAVQSARSCALPRSEWFDRIRLARAAIALADDFKPTPAPSGTVPPRGTGAPPESGPPLAFVGRRFELARLRALNASIEDPKSAYDGLVVADGRANESYKLLGDGKRVHSFARLGYLLQSMVEAPSSDGEFPPGLVSEIRGLLESDPDLDRLTAEMFTDWPADRGRWAPGRDVGGAPPNPLTNDVFRFRERALLAVISVVGAVGRDELALAWHRQIIDWLAGNGSGLTTSHHIRKLADLERWEQAEAEFDRWRRLERRSFDSEVLREMARARLGAGRVGEAEELFSEVATDPWKPTAVDGWSGLIDVARRQRDLQRARRLADEAKQALGAADGPNGPRVEVDETVVAQIDIALGWAETQLGSARRGLRLLIEGVRRRPRDLGAWTGVIRALRMLGAHREAIEVCRRLLGDGRKLPLGWIDEVPVLGSYRHSRLLSEFGWAHLDIGLGTEARQAFETALEVSPRLDAAYRGLVVAGRSSRQAVLAAERDCRDRLMRRGLELSDLDRAVALEVGCGLLMFGDRDGARERFQTVIDGLSSDAAGFTRARRYLFAMADAYLDQRMIPEAVELIEEVKRRAEALGQHEWRHRDERLVLIEARWEMAMNRADKAGDRLDRWRLERHDVVSEPFRIARAVAAFENREFRKAWELAHQLGCEPGEPVIVDDFVGSPVDEASPSGGPAGASRADSLPSSEIRSLLLGWIALAHSELPAHRRDEWRSINRAHDYLCATDRSSVEEIHLNAIVNARAARAPKIDRGSQDGDVSNRIVGTERQGRWPETGIDQQESRARGGCDGTYHVARSELLRAIERRPGDGALYRDLAVVVDAMGHRDAALDALERARHLSPHDARVYLLRGDMRFRDGLTDEAVADFRTAVALDPRDYVHHRALTVALLRMGRLDEAHNAVVHGLGVVEAQRWTRLVLLKARVVAERAQDSPERRRQVELAAVLSELRRARRVERLPRSEVAEIQAREGFISARMGDRGRAWLRFNQALSRDGRCEEARQLREQLGWTPFGGLLGPALASMILAVWGVLLLYVIWLNFGTAGELSPLQLAIILMALLFAPAVIPIVGVVAPRIRGLKLFQFAIELAANRPLEETVHVDLDLSASELVRVSGFSNHRPGFTLDDIEPRVLDI